MNSAERFESALYGIAKPIRAELEKLPIYYKENAEEIRLRAGLPVALTVKRETVLIKKGGQTSFSLEDGLLFARKEDINESFKLLTKSSVYAHTEELKNGFIMMEKGHRAGVFGTLTENGSMADITSLNIRIAREILGAANELMDVYDGGGLLIAGPPGSGKTTVLRDFIRQLSSGKFGKIKRIAVIDSRGELSGGNNQNDLGIGSDVLMTSDRAKGIEIALRTMFPDIIAFDEIGTSEELSRVRVGFSAGVDVITTAHIGDIKDLFKREITASLINSQVVNYVAVLPINHGEKINIINIKELETGVAV